MAQSGGLLMMEMETCKIGFSSSSSPTCPVQNACNALHCCIMAGSCQANTARALT